MIKTLTNLLKQDKEKFVVPKGVQDCIPITAIYDDGIFRVGKDKYSKSFKFTDINFAVASREDKEAMFLEYSELLNSFDSGATTKLTINNRRLNRLDFEKTILIPKTGDELDEYREEYNKMLLDKATGANSIVQDMKSVQGDSGHARMDMVADVYSHIIDEDRRYNAQKFEEQFYNAKGLKNVEEGKTAPMPKFETSVELLDPMAEVQETPVQEEENSADNSVEENASLIAKLLSNPETAALLKALAKTI